MKYSICKYCEHISYGVGLGFMTSICLARGKNVAGKYEDEKIQYPSISSIKILKCNLYEEVNLFKKISRKNREETTY